jgi:toxin-antitoxin system PIN domain toxin
VLVDANILLYSIDSASPFHTRADEWLTRALNGSRRVGLPWVSLWAFVRIVTNQRASANPLTPEQAWQHVNGWLEAPAAWIPEPGAGHAAIMHDLITRLDLRAALVSDAVLAALCIEHGLQIVSADSDFARFTEISWLNPIAPR